MTRESEISAYNATNDNREVSNIAVAQLSNEIESTDSISEIKVKPGEQSRVSLGKFNHPNPPKGFSISCTPKPQDGAIITQISKLELSDDAYELVLHVANYGDITVGVRIWQS